MLYFKVRGFSLSIWPDNGLKSKYAYILLFKKAWECCINQKLWRCFNYLVFLLYNRKHRKPESQPSHQREMWEQLSWGKRLKLKLRKQIQWPITICLTGTGTRSPNRRPWKEASPCSIWWVRNGRHLIVEQFSIVHNLVVDMGVQWLVFILLPLS